ncbi:MAG: hypothetical protein AAF529_24445 [Pseudomonadota bacterium]
MFNLGNKTNQIVLMLAVLVTTSYTTPVQAATVNDVYAKVLDTYQRVRTTLPKNGKNLNNQLTAVQNGITSANSSVSQVLGEVQSLSSMADVVGPLGDTTVINSIVDGVQPMVEMVQARQAEYAAFDAEGFRAELSSAVQTIADMQMAISGHVGPGITKLQMTLEEANPVVLFALSETPLVELIDKTQSLGGDIQMLVELTQGAISDIESHYATEQVIRFASLGMSAAAPVYVSCGFVLANVESSDIDTLNLIRLRMKQISGLSKIALEILPKSQTVGVNVVGGATLSIPNPVTPLVSSLKKVADKYYEKSENWTTKYDECAQDALMSRLDAFLSANQH